MFDLIARSRNSFPILILLPVAGILGIVVAFALFDADPFAEGATVERSTTAVLFLTAATFLVALVARGWRSRWHLVAVLVLLGLREMDFDKAFLSEGILQLRLYTGDAPIVEKLAGAAVVAMIAWLMLRLIRRDLPAWLRGLRDRRQMPLLLLAAGIAVVVAKTLDGLQRKLSPFGVTLPPGAPRIFAALEESLELGFALALLVAVLLWWQGNARA